MLFTAIAFLICTKLFSQTNNGIQQPDSSITATHFLFNKTTFDTISLRSKINFYNNLKPLNCIAGIIFFTGTGFPNTVAIQYRGSAEMLQSYFDRCTSGSKFTLEKCVFKNKDGSISKVTKSIFFR